MPAEALAVVSIVLVVVLGAITLLLYMRLRRMKSEWATTVDQLRLDMQIGSSVLEELRLEIQINTLSWVLNASRDKRLANEMEKLREELRQQIGRLARRREQIEPTETVH